MTVDCLGEGIPFKVVGWNKEVILNIVFPFKEMGSIKLCTGRGPNVAMVGLGVLAGRGEIVDGQYEDLYFLPTTTEVELITK